MIRLGLFGGTFDPAHYGHLRPVEAARIELGLEEVLMLPNPQPPHKSRELLTPYLHRKEMLRLALMEFPALKIADFEESAIGPAYTTDTVRRIIASLPVGGERELWLIIGADSLIELPHWKDPEALFRNTNVAVLPRPGIDLSNVSVGYLQRIRVLSTPLIPISATEIRRSLKNGESVSEWISPRVQKYIRENGLYR